jgi:hypothetical protein
MNPNLRLKVFPVVMLTVVQVVGMGGVARSTRYWNGLPNTERECHG